MVAWGQERAFEAWRRLRGPRSTSASARRSTCPPAPSAAAHAKLHGYTDELMLTLARMLPEQYRGVLRRDAVTDDR